MDNVSLVQFTKGTILFKEGDSDRDMFIIRSGKVGIYKSNEGKQVLVAQLEPGSFIGEMSFVSGLERSATAKAEEDVTASKIHIDLLQDEALGIHGWAVNIARVIADRIRRTTNLFIGEFTPEDDTNAVTPIYALEEKEIEIQSCPKNNIGEIFLKGYLRIDHLENLKAEIRALTLKGCSQVVIDFSDVPDIDNGITDFLSLLTQNQNLFPNTTVTIKNVQLIRSKLLSIKGIRELISETRLPTKRITMGDNLINQGGSDPFMYVVKTGSFSIYRQIDGKEMVLGTAEIDDVIGEMSLVAGGLRSASVKALQSSVVYCIDVEEFNKNSYSIPSWFMELIRSLVIRLRKTNEMLEMAVRRQSQTRTDQDEPQQKAEKTPIGIELDSSQPGSIHLEGFLIKDNREYLSTMMNLLLKRGIIDITLHMKKLQRIDYDSIRYLLKLYVYLQKKGGLLQFESPHQDISTIFNQYEIYLDYQ